MLLSVPDVDFSPEQAQAALNDLAHRDDVLCDDFTSAVILQSSQGGGVVDLNAVASRLAQSSRFPTVFTVGPVPFHGSLPQDPTSSTASQFTKLGSFTKTNSTRLSSRPFLTMFPAPPQGQFAQAQAAARVARAHDYLVLSSFSVLQAASHKGTFKSIAVPNRLYAAPNKEKPLAGARIGIKDNYDLEGIRTTMMNRAYNELYPPRTSSADFVIKLT